MFPVSPLWRQQQQQQGCIYIYIHIIYIGGDHLKPIPLPIIGPRYCAGVLGRAISTSPWRKKTLRTPFFQGFSPDFRKKKPIPKHSMYMVHPYHTQIEQKEVNISCFECCGIRTSVFQNVKDVNFQDLKKCWNLLEINWQNVEMCHDFCRILSQGWHDFGPESGSKLWKLYIHIHRYHLWRLGFPKNVGRGQISNLVKRSQMSQHDQGPSIPNIVPGLDFLQSFHDSKSCNFFRYGPLGYVRSLIN